MQIVLVLAVALLSALQGSVAQTMDPVQLAAWQSIFDSTKGTTWTRCKGKRDTPCTCEGTTEARVTCVVEGDTQFITSVRLRNNNLVAPNVPVEAINTLIGGFSGFTSVDMLNNGKMKNTVGGCLNIPNCVGKTCTFDFRVCAPPTESPTSGSPTTAPPTAAPTFTGLAAWRRFFDRTGGANWSRCKTTRTTPCDCQRNADATAPVKVVCAGANKPVRISLIENNLVAATFPTDDVNNLINSGVVFLDLSNNTRLDPTAECFDAPACSNAGVTCVFSKPLCGGAPTTESPSEASASPTTSPIAVTESPSATVPPSIVTPPPSTAVPTTAAPTSAAPTTAAPTSPTQAPSGTTSPTTPTTSSTPTTAAPSSESTTGAPSTAPSVSVNTPAPTAPPVAVDTQAPTESAAVVANGIMSGVAAFLVAGTLLMF